MPCGLCDGSLGQGHWVTAGLWRGTASCSYSVVHGCGEPGPQADPWPQACLPGAALGSFARLWRNTGAWLPVGLPLAFVPCPSGGHVCITAPSRQVVSTFAQNARTCSVFCVSAACLALLRREGRAPAAGIESSSQEKLT